MKEMIKDLNKALESGAEINEDAKSEKNEKHEKNEEKHRRLRDRFKKGAKSEALKRKKK